MSYNVMPAPRGASLVSSFSDSAKCSLFMIKDSYFALFLNERREIKLDDIDGLGAEISCIISSLLKSTGTNLSSLSSRIAETL
jgi:hypothetical protein